MKTARDAILGLLLAALLAAATALCWQAYRVLGDLPERADAVIRDEADLTRQMIGRELAATRNLIRSESGAIRSQAIGEIGRWRIGTLSAIDQIRLDAKGELRETRHGVLDLAGRRMDALESVLDRQLSATNGHVGRVADAYAALPASIGARLDPWTNCAGNGACWQAQFTAALGASRATLGETSRTMRTIREATPEITANIDKTAANVERMTRPDSWSVRFVKLAGPFVGGALFGALK